MAKLVGRTSISYDSYTRKVRQPKWNVPVSPITSDYPMGGRLLRGRISLTKSQHHQMGDLFAHRARSAMAAWDRTVGRAESQLAKRGIDQGPMISGIVSDKFPDTTKTLLRKQVEAINFNTSAAYAHYAASGIRNDTARNRFNAIRDYKEA